jgi:serine/threonine protein kinase/Flp pilus assembly protein TadD
VDLEYGWARGQPTPLEDYQRRFPELFRDPASFQAVTFEEYRLRKQAGEEPRYSEYLRRFPLEGAINEAALPEPVRATPASDTARPSPDAAGNTATAEPPPAAAPQPAAPAAEAAAAPPEEDELLQAARSFRAFRRSDSGAGLEEWLAAQAVKGAGAELFRDLYHADPQAADRLARAVTELPRAGTDFLGFHLLAELGRGAFGKVYLARQGDLANRLVALKVSTELFAESQTLAQLQHTHIVPIWSLHRTGPFQAVCMPYLGATTLADVLKQLCQLPGPPENGKALTDALTARREALKVPQACSSPLLLARLEGRSYVEAVLTLAADLAEGLAHAHERGILHRDLKPANVLLTDDGQPMLLDFNLSQDTKLRSNPSAALIGGTLPYMAPEHLEAFEEGRRSVDARSDIYSLGLIIYELLARRPPFAVVRGPMPQVLARMRRERGHPPALRRFNPAVTPAVEAIVARCLEPEPARRYQHAAQLAEDLRRQLAQLPLRHTPEPSPRERFKKWRRRHPRLTSAVSVAGVLGAGLLAVAVLCLYLYSHLMRLQAAEALHQFRDEARHVQYLILSPRTESSDRRTEGETLLRKALDRYGVLDDPAWRERRSVSHLPPAEQAQLQEEVGELLLLWARVMLDRPVAEGGGAEAALRLNQLAEACYAPGQAPRVLWEQRARLTALLGDRAEAERLAGRAKQTPATEVRGLGLLAEHLSLDGRWQEARTLLQQAVRQQPQNFWLWANLALCQEALGNDVQAIACYGTCTALRPDFAPLYYHRGVAHLRRQEYALAVADLDQALRLRPDWGEALVQRALALAPQGRLPDAIADLTRALELDSKSPATRLWFLRARLREQAGDREGASRDRVEGMRQEPVDEIGWIARGEARLSSDPEAALRDFDQALVCNSRSKAALQDRAHVLAERLGRTEEAVRTLDQLLTHYPDHAPSLTGRGVLLARLGKRDRAVRDAQAALLLDTRPALLYQAGCVYALASRQQPSDRFQALQLLAAALRGGYGADLLASDRDLDPLRQLPEFRHLLEWGGAGAK